MQATNIKQSMKTSRIIKLVQKLIYGLSARDAVSIHNLFGIIVSWIARNHILKSFNRILYRIFMKVFILDKKRNQTYSPFVKSPDFQYFRPTRFVPVLSLPVRTKFSTGLVSSIRKVMLNKQ